MIEIPIVKKTACNRSNEAFSNESENHGIPPFSPMLYKRFERNRARLSHFDASLYQLGQQIMILQPHDTFQGLFFLVHITSCSLR